MVDWLLGSYLGIVLVLFLTGCGLPLPEEVPIIAAGVLAANGTLDWRLALVACIVGCLAGDCAMYYIGRRFGRRVLKDHPRWVAFLTPEREKEVEEKIRQHGLKVLFVARFLAGLRMPVYVTAGILKMPFRRFVLVDLLCATVVVAAFFGLSYLYGKEILAWIRGAEVTLSIVAVCGAVIALLIWWRRARRREALLALEDGQQAETHVSANLTGSEQTVDSTETAA